MFRETGDATEESGAENYAADHLSDDLRLAELRKTEGQELSGDDDNA